MNAEGRTYATRGGRDRLLEELESEIKRHQAERKRLQAELGAERDDLERLQAKLSAEKNGGVLRKVAWKVKPEARKRRRRLIFLLLFVVVLAAYFLSAFSAFGVRPPVKFAQLAEEEQAVFERPEVYEPPEIQEHDAAASEQPAEEEESETNVYAATMTEEVKESLADLPERVYVPNIMDGTIDVIDPETFQTIDHFEVQQLPFHITPAWDMSVLLVNNEQSSTFTVIDPKTGRPSGITGAPYPYNFYYTPDGSRAIVVSERLQTIGFRDAETWELIGSVYVPWPGVDHLDFSADGSYFLASSEWSGVVSKIDVEKMELVDYVEVTGALPIDVRLSPDGSVFYVANQGSHGVSVIDPVAMEEIGFIPTGQGAHGLQISRDTKSMYVANRLEGTISVIDLATNRVVDTWVTGGTPDMMQISVDGRQLWVSGRYDGAVYVLDTRSGQRLATIYTGAQPHGLTYFPNPGRFSLGHNGVYR
jgi:YVTN family beta-propeller protein